MTKRSDNLKKLKSVVMVLLLMVPLYAQSSPFSGTGIDGVVNPKKSAVSGYVKQDGIFKLAIDNPEGLRYRISVTDDRGKVWYQETTSSEMFRRLLDLSYLSSKRLKVVVTASGEEVVYVIHRMEAKYSVEKTVE